MRWLKLNREEVDDNGPLSPVYEPARCSVIRGDFLDERIISACLVEARVRLRWGGMWKMLATPAKDESRRKFERNGFAATECKLVPARVGLYLASVLGTPVV